MLSIIIIGRNEGRTLPETFEACEKIHVSGVKFLQVIYVDSDSTDNSIELAEKFRARLPVEVRIARASGDRNAAIARNIGRGLLADNSGYVLFLDGDIVPDAAFVEYAMTILEHEETAGTVSGSLDDIYLSNGNRTARSRVYKNRIDERSIGYHGGNFMIRRQLLDQIGPFDERLVLYEDNDFCFRLRKKGYKLINEGRRFGEHYSESYTAMSRVLADIKSLKYLSSGILFRRYLLSGLLTDAVSAVKGAVLRLGILLLLAASFFISPWAAVLPLLMLIAVVARRDEGLGETRLSRLLSFVFGLQFLAGLVYFPGEKRYRFEEL